MGRIVPWGYDVLNWPKISDCVYACAAYVCTYAPIQPMTQHAICTNLIKEVLQQARTNEIPSVAKRQYHHWNGKKKCNKSLNKRDGAISGLFVKAPLLSCHWTVYSDKGFMQFVLFSVTDLCWYVCCSSWFGFYSKYDSLSLSMALSLSHANSEWIVTSCITVKGLCVYHL